MITKTEIKFIKELMMWDEEDYVLLNKKDLNIFFKLYKDKESLLFECIPNCKVWKQSDGKWRFYFNSDHDQRFGGKHYEIRGNNIIELSEDKSKYNWMHPEKYLTLITTERVLYLSK